LPEWGIWLCGLVWPALQPVDSLRALVFDARAHAIARCGERHVDRAAVVLGHAVALSAERRNGELGQLRRRPDHRWSATNVLGRLHGPQPSPCRRSGDRGLTRRDAAYTWP